MPHWGHGSQPWARRSLLQSIWPGGRVNHDQTVARRTDGQIEGISTNEDLADGTTSTAPRLQSRPLQPREDADDPHVRRGAPVRDTPDDGVGYLVLKKGYIIKYIKKEGGWHFGKRFDTHVVPY